MLESARRLLSSLEGFQAEVDDIHQTLTGTLKLGIFDQSTTNPKANLHAAIRTFDQSAPDVTLEDSGELSVGSYYAGVPHPPGYPVWTLYTWLFAMKNMKW